MPSSLLPQKRTKGLAPRSSAEDLGLHDDSITNLSLLDKDRKAILWSAEAGDRTLMFGAMGRGSERATAESLSETTQEINRELADQSFTSGNIPRWRGLSRDQVELDVVMYPGSREAERVVKSTRFWTDPNPMTLVPAR